MDLETENRLAALLMEEARRLRAEADKEGVHAYLRQPNVRGRPNSRFLTATVLGVQQGCLTGRAKRGRGAIGSRMDEPGPYPLSTPVNHDGNEQRAGPDSREKKEWKHHVVGPPKPSFIKSSHESSSEEEHYADSSKKKHRSTQKKRTSKEGRSERKKTKEKKKSKHIRHQKSRRRRDNE